MFGHLSRQVCAVAADTSRGCAPRLPRTAGQRGVGWSAISGWTSLSPVDWVTYLGAAMMARVQSPEPGCCALL